MKGDERVEPGEEGADAGLLFDLAWQSQLGFKEIAGRDVKQAVVSGAFGGNQPNPFVPTVSFVVSHQKRRIAYIEPKTNVKGR
ncbi:hypothetical protein [Adlercreutzia equolifaciens]|uniref:hypothetical protein n=2 Tax=Adlercreutzia TaxID=447020 RepID=UPI002670B5F8|nr:hypothetical protein [Adlercreutzia equolifaciens]